MTKSKRREPRDRLSELPDALIFHILWFLPMRYVVFTSVLSSRWNSLWTTTPYLNFDFSLESNRLDPQKFISRALLSWRGIRILKFKIEFMYPYAQSLGIDFDLWMRFAVEKRVEELYLHGYEFDKEKREFEVPQWLYSCSSLKELSLIGCDIQINGNGNVQWSQLKSLTIDGKSFSNCERVIDQVLCGAPQLEILNLVVMDIDTNLTIRSSSLRKLSIENFYYYINPSTLTELRIWTPNLETLEILGDPYTKCLLMNVSSLTRATLRFNELKELLYDDILGETLRQIFPAIQHVEMVSLSSLCIKVLARMTKERMISPLSNVKFLNIKVDDEDVVEIFRKMKILVLLDEDRSSQPVRIVEFDGKSCQEFFPEIFPKLQLLRLHVYKYMYRSSVDSWLYE